jgi:hypothetical protein
MKETRSPKRRFLQDPHGATSQKTAFFIVTAVNSNPTNITQFTNLFWVICFCCRTRRHQINVIQMSHYLYSAENILTEAVPIDRYILQGKFISCVFLIFEILEYFTFFADTINRMTNKISYANPDLKIWHQMTFQFLKNLFSKHM